MAHHVSLTQRGLRLGLGALALLTAGGTLAAGISDDVVKIGVLTDMSGVSADNGPSSFRVEPNSQNRWSSSSPVGMWAGCI